MIERVLSYLERKKRLRRNKALISRGILKTGNNTNIGQLDIVLAADIPDGAENIIIGNDCIINSKIVLYSADAKVEIGDRVYLGNDTTFFCYNKITLEDDILFSWGITVIDTNAHSLDFELRKKDVQDWQKGKKDWNGIRSAPVLIKSGAWIGFNSIITKGVTIGTQSIVACGSVVIKNINDYKTAGGNPAQIIN